MRIREEGVRTVDLLKRGVFGGALYLVERGDAEAIKGDNDATYYRLIRR